MFKFFSNLASRTKATERDRALYALKRGELSNAETQFTALLSADALPADERAFLLNKRGAARARLDGAEPARADFEEALKLVPDYAPALVNLGNVLLENGRLEDAVASYERAIAADAGYAAAYFNLSVARKRQGEFAAAVRALRTAQKLEARSPNR